jgi:hypothetical protein
LFIIITDFNSRKLIRISNKGDNNIKKL